MKTLLLFATLVIIFTSVVAQNLPPSIIWQRAYGGSFDDEARDLQLTKDGGCIFAGFNKSRDGDVTGNKGAGDFWVVKLDSNNNIQWQKSLGGTLNDWGRGISLTSDGGYVITGYEQSSDGDVTGNHGGYDYWVVKLDSAGNMQWQTALGGSDFDNAYSVVQTVDSGYIVSGYISSTDGNITGEHGGQDYWVCKLDARGNLQWEKAYGGSHEEEASNLKQTRDGGYIVCGYSNSNDGDVTGNHGSFDAWILKLTSTGNIQWQKSYGGSMEDGLRDIDQTSDGGYLAGGYAYSDDGDVNGNHGNSDIWIFKTDSLGNLQWQKTYGGSQYEYCYFLQQMPDGSFLAAGTSASSNGTVTQNHGGNDCWVFKIDSLGNLIWQESLGGSSDDIGRAIIEDRHGKYYMDGYTMSNDGNVTGNHGGYDAWVVCLQDAKTFYHGANIHGCANTSLTTTLKQVSNPSAIITAQGSLNICSTHSVTLTANSGMKNYLWYKGSTTIAGATKQNYVATEVGNYKVTITDQNGYSGTSGITKVTSSCREEISSAEKDLLEIFPNPCSGDFHLKLPLSNSSAEKSQVEIENEYGKIIYAGETNFNGEISSEIKFDAAAGLYFVRAMCGEKKFTAGLLVQK